MRNRVALACVGAVFSMSGLAFGQQALDPGPSIALSEAPGVIRIRAFGVKADGTMDGDDGTGFVISKSGYVLTASHVVPDGHVYQTVLMTGYFGPATGAAKAFRLKLVQRSDLYDAALLQIADPQASLTSLPLRAKPAQTGEMLFVLGYPLGLPDMHFLDGRVGAVADDAITTNALIDKGNS